MKEKLLQEKYLRRIILVIVAVCISLLVEKAGKTYAMKLMVALIFTFSIGEGNIGIMFYFRRKFFGLEQTSKRGFYTVAFILIYTLIIQVVLKMILSIVGINPPFTLSQAFDKVTVPLVASTLVGFLYEANFFFNQWKKVLLEKEELENRQLRSQLDSLKDQISPNFLFKSLHTLEEIIPQNPDLASEFTEKLSEVYRYILQHQDQELIYLKQEVEFTQSYIFLLKMQYQENLQFDIALDAQLLNQHIAPLTLQILVENAVRHNEISSLNPLKIKIYAENNHTIVVKNNLQKQSHKISSAKKGLENIKKRYQYLSNQQMEIITTTANFLVALPIINIE